MRNVITKIISTVFYLGLIPIAQGSITSLFALFLYFFIGGDLPLYIAIVAISCILGFEFSGRAEEILKTKDARAIVIDEWCGMLIAFLFIKPNIAIIICGYCIFRALDIKKPLIIGELEALKGSWGIMLDDIIAGVLTNIVLQLGIIAFKVF